MPPRRPITATAEQSPKLSVVHGAAGSSSAREDGSTGETPPREPDAETPSGFAVFLEGFARAVRKYPVSLVRNLWPRWRESGYNLCTDCGGCIDPASGVCNQNSTHQHAPYVRRGTTARNITL